MQLFAVSRYIVVLRFPDRSSYQLPRGYWSTAVFRSYIFEVEELIQVVPKRHMTSRRSTLFGPKTYVHKYGCLYTD